MTRFLVNDSLVCLWALLHGDGIGPWRWAPGCSYWATPVASIIVAVMVPWFAPLRLGDVGPPIPTPPLLLGYCEGEPGGVWGAENRQYIGVTKHCSHATMQAPIPSPTCTTVMPRTAGQSSQFLGDRCGESGDRETSEHIGQPACCGERGWAGPELEVMELR